MKNEATLTKEQARALAVALYPEIKEYIKTHREEFEQYKKEQALQKGGEHSDISNL